MPRRTAGLVPAGESGRPEFRTVHLSLEPAAAVDRICERMKGCVATETPEQITIRTTRGALLATLEPGPGDDGGTVLQYRTAPASETVTLKARTLWRALEPFAE
jgi:hypothetical protein